MLRPSILQEEGKDVKLLIIFVNFVGAYGNMPYSRGSWWKERERS
jgi:hypothetical protein